MCGKSGEKNLGGKIYCTECFNITMEIIRTSIVCRKCGKNDFETLKQKQIEVRTWRYILKCNVCGTINQFDKTF
jgi:hypothetical protein